MQPLRLISLCALAGAGIISAQFAGDWTTTGFDAQRSFWVRSDGKISLDTMRKPGFELVWKANINEGMRAKSFVTPSVLIDFYIGYRGFRALGFVANGANSVLALDTDFSLISLLGLFLLIGIVMKNAILIIDFALSAERDRGLSPRAAIFEAAHLRFRPILMTSAAALFGALPLMFGSGDGAEMRRPLGITIVGGLIVSQLLTLYTTPVIYLYLDRFRLWANSKWPQHNGQAINPRG